jgi:hypothetical protein
MKAKPKSQSTIKRHLKQLRKQEIESDDPIAFRIAYAMEQAVRWATEATVGWPGLAEQARIEAGLLRRELGRGNARDAGDGEAK